MTRVFRAFSTAASRLVRGAGRSRGSGRPARAAGGRARLPGLISLLAGLCALVAVGLAFPRLADDFDFWSGARALELTSQDVDAESTALLVRLLRDNQVDGRLALALVREARPGKSELKELSAALNQGKVPPRLAAAAETMRTALGKGDAGVYTVWVRAADSRVQGSVILSLDGCVLGNFSLDENRCALSLLLKTGNTAHLRIRALSTNDRSVVLYGETAGSEARTRRLRPGESDEWMLLVPEGARDVQ